VETLKNDSKQFEEQSENNDSQLQERLQQEADLIILAEIICNYLLNEDKDETS